VDSQKKALACIQQACAVFRAVGMMQRSVPCDRAISAVQNDLEPSASGTRETPKTSE